MTVIEFIGDGGIYLFTNLTMDQYKYKELDAVCCWVVISPTTTTTFSWDGCDIGTHYSNAVCGEFRQVDVEVGNDSSAVVVDVSLDFFENLIYDKVTDGEIAVREFIKGWCGDVGVFCFKYIRQTELEELVARYSLINPECVPLFGGGDMAVHGETFMRKKLYQKTLAPEICYWIITEAESVNRWDRCTYNNYETYFNIEQLPAVFSFIKFVSTYYLETVAVDYKIKGVGASMNIKDMFLCKYSVLQIGMELTSDPAHFSINILLNSLVDFLGGVIVFNDGLRIVGEGGISDDIVKMDQGDMLIYNGLSKRTSGCISKGVRYMLCILVDLV